MSFGLGNREDLPSPASIDSYLLPVKACLVTSLLASDDDSSSLVGDCGPLLEVRVEEIYQL